MWSGGQGRIFHHLTLNSLSLASQWIGIEGSQGVSNQSDLNIFVLFVHFPISHLFPPSYHNQEVVIRIKMAEFIVAFQRQPEVGSKMQFPVLFQVDWQRYL